MAAQRVHIIGIGGSGASGVARYLHAIGFTVTGSDAERPRTVGLKQIGLAIADSHAPANVDHPDLVLTTPGLFAADTELQAAKDQGVPIMSWQEFVGRYLDRRPGKGVMVAGTYGKGSTAAIVGHILTAAYLDPLVILGVEDTAWGSNLRLGFGNFWVMEADEYNRNFLHYHPAYAGLTSFEHEHISTYPTFADYGQGFLAFFNGLRDPKAVVAKRTASIDAARGKIVPNDAISYSLDADADVRGTVVKESIDGSTFTVSAPRFNLKDEEFHLRVPGRIHIENAVGAIALTMAAGVSAGAVHAGLGSFQGLKRRFELVRTGPNVTIFDYAHTPDRMTAVIEQARSLFTGRRLLVLFEPHLYSRTMQLADGFRQVLATADRAYVTDIYPSREARSELGQTIHSRDLAAAGQDRVIYAGSLSAGIEAVRQARTERDVLLVFGAGPIQGAADVLAA